MDHVRSRVIPLSKADIDTDVIIPAEFLTTTTRCGLGQHLFAEIKKIEPDFPFNQACYQNAKILVTRKNFGCGSSREHAAWALADWGISVVIAPSFADIFYNNAMKNQILPIRLDEEVVERILEESTREEYEMEVCLSEQYVRLPDGTTLCFEIEPYRKECLIKGLDDLDYLLMNLPAIETYESQHYETLYFHPDYLP